MSTDDHWITTRLTEARTCHPLVTEAVASQMTELLKGKVSEQPLSQMNLKRVAMELIAHMAAAPPETDAKR